MPYSPPLVVTPRLTQIMISTISLEAIGLDLRLLAATIPQGANYPAANITIGIPFGVGQPILVRKLWVQNQTPVAGNIDLGIFLPDGTLVVNKGSTASAGTNTIQELDITDTTLMPGRYYLGMTSDTSAATQKIFSTALASAGLASAAGVLQAAQGPALASVTWATCAQTQIPYIGLSARTLVV